MIEYTPFRAEHLNAVVPQDAQRREYEAWVRSAGSAKALEGLLSLSAWDGLRCLGFAGLVPVHSGRAVAWVLFGKHAGLHMLAITRKVRRVIAASPYRRVELTVASGHKEGHRFARLLGARLETPEPMRAYGRDGRDEYMYAIVRD